MVIKPIQLKCQVCDTEYGAEHGLGVRLCSDTCWWIQYDIDKANEGLWADWSDD